MCLAVTAATHQQLGHIPPLPWAHQPYAPPIPLGINALHPSPELQAGQAGMEHSPEQYVASDRADAVVPR